MHRLWLLLCLAIVTAGGIGGALMLSLKEDGALHHEEQWVQALLEAGLIATLGVVLSWVLERYKAGEQQRRDESKVRLGVLSELSRAYMDVKLVRRKLQAGEPFSDALRDRLNQDQVAIELHARTSTHLFRQSAALKHLLTLMEKYLNKVANKPESPERGAFRDAAGFRGFSTPYRQAVALILQEITGRGAGVETADGEDLPAN
jgi:hypothetical protein